MNKTKFDIQSLLNLRTDLSIGTELAQRQLNVIRTAYEYLIQPGNNIVYVADEVGLGKTYIAIGIALLLRHQAPHPDNHKDLVIVPKKNLQAKWKKEIENFVERNYLPDDTIKQGLSDHIVVPEKLRYVASGDRISIFRTTAFSYLATPKADLYDYLITNILPDEAFYRQVMGEARVKGYFNKENETLLRKLVACLLNIATPPIQCLIVDEAHNYKHGENTALRNMITSRFLGAVKDEKILQDFPALRDRMKFPLAEKVVCLSATPKDRELSEIKNQFNCFTNRHILSNATSAAEIKDNLHRFLIRGNLNYLIEGEQKSRNQCRVEHRKGNINKSEEAARLVLKDDFESLCWQLLQYKSLKYLSAKNNARFEIGMLAGFESYQLDVQRKATNAEEETGEYDLVRDNVANKSQDQEVVQRIIDSYKENFNGKLPPHPKQTRMEQEIIRLSEEADKSLIFVRRVASAHELHARLIQRYEAFVYEKQLKSLPQKLRAVKPVAQLINAYLNKGLSEKLQELYAKLCERQEIRSYFRALSINSFEEQTTRLKHAFDQDNEFARLAKECITRKNPNISHSLKQAVLTDLTASASSLPSLFTDEEDLEDDENQEKDQNEFLFSFFFREGQPGNAYREKTYREDWFDIDLLAFNKSMPFAAFDHNALDQKLAIQEKSFAKKKKQREFEQRQDLIRSFILKEGHLELGQGLPKEKTTFLTHLLTHHCREEMNHWLQNRAAKGLTGVINDLEKLGVILKNIFRSGSGRLAGFVSDASDKGFSETMEELLLSPTAPFRLVYQEVKTIIRDFDLLVSINFNKKDSKFIAGILRAASSPIVVTTGQDDIDREALAARFRMPGYPYVLVTTDIFREGEDLHTYCQNVYHYGIAWNPSDMEQRTGRIDRINSLSYRKLTQENKLHFGNKVQVFYPYMPQSIEVNQVKRLLENVDAFTRTFNNIEKQIIYESQVSANDEVEASDIPPQITEFLKSQYDVDQFNG